ncbi:MAG TPA: nucleoside triphosphate pyrophosphohydrolase [bacterium]|nr:nucleoside triphosphate pyrophosphohydrolase [bacterium]
MDDVKRLEKLMTRLRAPRGCPWDRRQTHQSLKPYLLEEAHEVLDAIDRGSMADLREELGDLLLQVVFHSQLAKERGAFNFQQVARGIGDKLIRRHPHVFGQGGSRKIADINRKWEELKRQEKPGRRSALDGLPKSLPALLRSQRMQEKMAKGGTVQSRRSPAPWAKALKSLAASRGTRARRERALGELLLSLTRWAGENRLHAEMALTAAADRLERDYRRREKKERKAGRTT